MRKAMVLGVLGLAGTLASPAFADNFTGFRLGINASQDRLEGSLFLNPLMAEENIGTNRFGYGLFGGWALNKYVAFEAGLRSGTEFNTFPFQNLLTTPGDFVTSHTDVKGADVSVVGSLWIGNKVSFYGRAGLMAWQAEHTMSIGNFEAGTKATATVDDDGFDPMFGVGIQSVLDRALLRFEYRRAELGDLGLANGFNLHDNTVSSLEISIAWTLR